MKKIFLALSLFLFSCHAGAQFFQIAEGPLFPAPVNGVVKILQMKNGSSIFLHVNFDSLINVQVYEPEYRVRTESSFQPTGFDLKGSQVEAVFETNGDVALMISKTAKGETGLHRLVIDGKTGKLKSEQQITSVKIAPVKPGDGGALQLPLPVMSVRRLPSGGAYAVAAFNANKADSSKRIEIILYDDGNHETGRGSYVSKTVKFSHLQYIDMAVVDNNKVAMVLYGYNLDKDGAKTGDLMLATFEKGEPVVKVNELNSSNDLVTEFGVVRYEKTFHQLLMVTTARVKSDTGKLRSFAGYIDLGKRELEINKPLYIGEKLKAKYAELFGKKSMYRGVPQQVLVDGDRNFTVVFEELEEVKLKDSVSHTLLRNTAVVTYNPELEVTSAYLVPLEHRVAGMNITPFYQSQREISGQLFRLGCQFKTTAYLTDWHNSYVLMNDLKANLSEAPKGKAGAYKDMIDDDSFFSQLQGADLVPERKYVFGQPQAGVEQNRAFFTVFDYDMANNMLILLKQGKESGRSGVRLVWLQP